MLHFCRGPPGGGGRGDQMRIKSPKDFWAGLMFIGTGLFFLIWAYAYYQMGTAVRMGPAYFPFVLGGLLAFLGLLVFVGGFALKDSGEPLRLPFSFLDLVIAVAIFGVFIYLATKAGISPHSGT